MARQKLFNFFMLHKVNDYVNKLIKKIGKTHFSQKKNWFLQFVLKNFGFYQLQWPAINPHHALALLAVGYGRCRFLKKLCKNIKILPFLIKDRIKT